MTITESSRNGRYLIPHKTSVPIQRHYDPQTPSP